MAGISKARREADEFRKQIVSLLAEPHGWHGFEDQRYWLQKLLRRDGSYAYTEAERKAVRRIVFARTPFKGWAGYSVPELTKEALRYVADLGDPEEQFLRGIEAEHATQSVIGDMRALVSLCITAGMNLPRFNLRPDAYDYDDA
jgi:hypothetical protein